MKKIKPTGYAHLPDWLLKQTINDLRKRIPDLSRTLALMRRELKRRVRKGNA